jgi:tetratricopeptide (TPR) repeat protein
MRIPLQSPTRKIILLGPALLLALSYLGFAATEYLASYFSEKPDLANLQRAVQLAPGNAEYAYRLGRYFSLVAMSPSDAAQHYRSAVALDPHRSRYWLGLATTSQVLGETASQTNALEHAIDSDPKTPDVAWQAANLFLVQGETAKAMHEFRVVLESDPYLTGAALQLCWRANPNIDALLQDVVPRVPSVYSAFLELLLSRKQSDAAAKVWSQMVQLREPVETQGVFEYVRYLIRERDVAQARAVWQQAATISDLSNYQPSPTNLVINGDFSLPILNGGLDWQYEKQAGVSFALDPTESHLGTHSLLISFAGRPIDEVGIRQFVPVEPNTRYEFSAQCKAPHMEGAGGARFAVEDFYAGTTLFLSDDLKNAEVWKQINGALTTGPDTRLLIIRLQRIPANSPIRGNLWVDGVRLVAAQQESQR